MKELEKELIEFLKHVKEVHTDRYGHLEVCEKGDELDPTFEKVVRDYLDSKQLENPIIQRDIYQELRVIGLTHDQCDSVMSLINTLPIQVAVDNVKVSILNGVIMVDSN